MGGKWEISVPRRPGSPHMKHRCELCGAPGPGRVPEFPGKCKLIQDASQTQLWPAAAEPEGGEASAQRTAPRVPFSLAPAKSHDLRPAWLHARTLQAELWRGCSIQARGETAPGAAWVWGFPYPRKGSEMCLSFLVRSHAGAPSLSSLTLLLDALSSLLFRVKCTRFPCLLSPLPNLAEMLCEAPCLP